jgi:hypothetical protein
MVVLVLTMFFAPWAAHAQPQRLAAARDVIDGSYAPGALTLPPLPDGYTTERRGPLVISYPRALRDVVDGALQRAERDARNLAQQFGLRSIPELTVRLVADPDEMRRLAPREVPPPDYAVGVAYPPARVALVSATAPRTRTASNMGQVLRHELSHLLLAEAAGSATVPRWLSEGVAVQQSEEHTYERFQELASAHWTRRLLPLARLDEGFVEGPDTVNVAYAQSADFVAWIIRRDGVTRFGLLLGHLREGLTLDEAVHETYDATLERIEQDWRSDLDGRMSFAPLWAGTGFLSIAGAVFVVVAMVKRYRRNRHILAKWDREERAVERARRWALFGGRPPLRLVRDDETPRPPTLH